MSLFKFVFILTLAFSTSTFAAISSGEANGTLSTILVNKAEVQKLLPTGWTIEPVSGVPLNLHPVSLYVGTHSNLSALVLGQTIPVTKFYNEVVYAITNVKPAGKNGLYAYATALRLDDSKAIKLGRVIGMPKEFAQFEKPSENFLVVKNERGTIAAISKKQTLYFNQDNFITNFNILNSMIQPLVVQIAGHTMCIDFNWNLDINRTAPASLSFSAEKAFGNIVSGTYNSPSLDESHLGTVLVNSNWTMSAPRECK